jgi:uncharacterized membrane protein
VNPPPPDETPAPDLRTWQTDLTAAQHSQLRDVRAVAASWATSLALVIGIVGTASVIFVPKTLDKFNDPDLQHAVFWLALIGGVAALVALIFAILAAQGWPKSDDLMDAGRYEEHVVTGAKKTAWLLKLSRWITAGAVLLIITASACSQADTLIQKHSPSNVVVIGSNGKLHCGPASSFKMKVTSVVSVTTC